MYIQAFTMVCSSHLHYALYVEEKLYFVMRVPIREYLIFQFYWYEK